MSIIKSQDVNEIIRRTLGIINPKIIVHGEIVGYMLYKMLEYDAKKRKAHEEQMKWFENQKRL